MAEQEFKHIIRIVKTDLKGEKAIRYALTRVKGVGKSLASAVCRVAGIDANKRAGDLTDQEIEKVESIVMDPLGNKIPNWMVNRRKDNETGEDKHLLSGDLQFQKDNDIKFLRKIRCYRGVRHEVGLPSRGQRTKSNFRKNKGRVTGVKKKGK